jgi:integrase-like protein
MFPYVGLRRGDAARFGKRHIPVTKRGSNDEDYSGHGLRKASATIVAESGATEAELNAMFGWSGHQMAQLYIRKADHRRLAARAKPT